MAEPALVTAADIARIAGVSRGTVSNWRRRRPDFPEPAGGTDASPAYDRGEVEAWLAARDSLPELPPDQRLWRAVTKSARTGDLGEAVLRAAREIQAGGTSTYGLAPQKALDSLLEQYADAAGISVTPSPVADLMAAIAEPAGGVVLDPACGTGELLAAAARHGAADVYGQELDGALADLAQIRIGLETGQGGHEHVAAGDSLRAAKFPDLVADRVLCHPPFAGKDWGQEELAHDPRWLFGTPPKNEPELAWAQAAFAQLKPGGRAVMLMPPALAARPSARRIRAEMVRKGAIRAVVSLPAGTVRPQHVPVHLWVLERPAASPDPRVLFIDAARHSQDTWQQTAERILTAWCEFTQQPAKVAVDLAGVVRAIDLLDDDVDLSPARHGGISADSIDPRETAERVALLRDRFRDALRAAADSIPQANWPTVAGERAWRMVTLADLDRDGSVTLRRVSSKQEQVTPEPGDVIIPAIATGAEVRGTVVTNAGAREPLRENVHLVRADPARMDPWFLAGFLAAPGSVRAAAYGTNGSRIDARRLKVPLLPLPEQQRYGRVFRELSDSEARANRVARLAAEFTELIRYALVEGAILPSDGQEA